VITIDADGIRAVDKEVAIQGTVDILNSDTLICTQSSTLINDY
jgi:hypothetical protein